MNYYIQGNKGKADQIKAAFRELGYNTRGLDFSCGFFCTVERDVHYCVYDYIVNIIKTHPDYQELELPKPHYDISNFHAGMPVLVRDNKNEEWRHTTFSHISSRFYENKFAAGCTYWCQCIPFEGNEHLLGTTDMCDEMYVNWRKL